jgi:hypothetical protein
VRVLSHLHHTRGQKPLVNPRFSCTGTRGTSFAQSANVPHLKRRFGVPMFGINKQQQQQEEASLCAALVIFNLALLSLFLFICVK